MPVAKKTALALVFDGVEELEAVATIDLLRRGKIEVVIASLDGSATVTGRNGIVLGADRPLEGLDALTFDLLVLPGGPGVQKLLDDPRVSAMVRARDAAGKPIAAICAAPSVLARAGVLDGRQATSHESVRAEIPNPSLSAVVEDGHIVTSQGAGTAVAFGLALVARLAGEDVAREIAASIHSDA